MLKFANSEEDPAVLDLQHQALLHIEARDPTFPVPRIIRTRDGGLTGSAEDAAGTPHIVRLLSYLPGIDVGDVEHPPTLLRNVGASLARLDLALRGFFHPAADHVLLWDVRRLPEMRHNTGAIADARLRGRVEQVADHYSREIAPKMAGFRCQIIHNDGNAGNLLVDASDHERIAGVIDYGDMIHGPLILDVAVAAAGVTYHKDDPVAALCELAAGFDSVLPLDADEVDALYDLVLALQCGVGPYSWVLHHNLGHHLNYLNQPPHESPDESRWARADGTQMGRLEYSIHLALHHQIDMVRVGLRHPRQFRYFLLMKLPLCGLIGVGLWLRPLETVLVFLLPAFITLFHTIWATYEHHAGCPQNDPLVASRNRDNRIYNALTGNLGLHTAHHKRPGLHWSLLPELHEEIRDQIPEEQILKTFW